MYLPIFRGRQYELLALDAEAQNNLFAKSFDEKQIIPIVDPVSLTTRLKKTIETFIANEQYIGIIFNSNYPYIDYDITELLDFIKAIMNYQQYVIPVVTMRADSKDMFKALFEIGYTYESCVITCLESEQIPNLISLGKDVMLKVKYILVGESRDFTRATSNNATNLVLCMDRFNKRDRNSDYKEKEDEFFSSDHIYFTEDGFAGVSDYSIIGNDNGSAGFAPRAIAIHIVYMDVDKNKELRVHHFVSESNFGIENPAKNFEEALSKLVKWVERNNIITSAVITFEQLAKEKRYPGLGTIKKLSIQQHLETMYSYFHQ